MERFAGLVRQPTGLPNKSNLHAASGITRWRLAEAVFSSEDYLSRVFRREMGVSPWNYLSHYRVSLALDLLRSSGDAISDIAARTGFRNQAYFCQVFRKIHGAAPGEARRTRGGAGGGAQGGGGIRPVGKV